MQSKTQRESAPQRLFLALAGLVAIMAFSACATTGKPKFHESANYDSRVRILVIHHTSSNFKSSMKILTEPSSHPVSAHYLVPEPNDKTYKEKHLQIYQLVPEEKRAWQAGKSYWGGKTSLNDLSIGIEIVNQAYCVKREQATGDRPTWDVTGKTSKPLCFFPDYAENQMDRLIDLIEGILKRHPRITPVNIVGHSDIAPDRKIDPGPRFPWQRLYQRGIGAWYDDATVIRYWRQFDGQVPPMTTIQKALGIYGYKIEQTGTLDTQTRNVISAFQMHFRPDRVTGEPDEKTIAILFALVEKYRPGHMDELLGTPTPTPQTSP
ncbi:MAG TPA: N-acetylmuramoyl-L-alanine amidase [Hellea balneolensis]|uniref:N-acetylmuramoyl-L-alanine amidase n=1 Tax=Hellea balneolensis TaxID=287478 RepID=A0A7V5U1N9_9PROT|nr:N-acetylmuramoyl-L-alanine amidase [Hellea balneolensis]